MLLVQEDSLEDMVLLRLVLVKLVLKGRAVEAHFLRTRQVWL